MREEHHTVVVVGSGFAGLGMAVALKREGIQDFVVLERADSIGGTWRGYHYPGCGCDVPTPLYSFSFAPNPGWSHFFARSGEIRAYLEDCADRFGLRPHLRFGADLTGGRWDEARACWISEINGVQAISAGVFTVTEGVGVAITRAPSFMRIGEVWSRRHLRRAIADPQLRAALIPSYRLGCKRILPSNDYYPALARPNVELVTGGIERVTPGGVIELLRAMKRSVAGSVEVRPEAQAGYNAWLQTQMQRTVWLRGGCNSW